MDWKQAIERWRSFPPQERARIRRERIPLNVAESMAFESEPVDLEMLRAEHERLESLCSTIYRNDGQHVSNNKPNAGI